MEPEDTTPLMERKLLHWKNKLIDLSRRNKLLNFRPSKVTTIELVGESFPDLDKVFERLVVKGNTFRFLPLPEEPQEAKETAEPSLIERAREEPQGTEVGEILEEQAQPEPLPGVGADTLQTGLDEKKLKHNLKRIEFKARQLLEEQGYNILFLSLGILEWTEEDEPEKRMQAPLILVPVEIYRKSVRQPYRLRRSEEEPFLNPALAYKLKGEKGLELPEMLLYQEEESFASYVERLVALLEGVSGWKVTPDIFLGLFSFSRFIMFKDLEQHPTLFQEHLQVRVLAGCPPAEGTAPLPTEPLKAEELDDKLDPENCFQVLDADSSQQEAIEAVKAGQSLVIQGPPGTGKSQTITNIIAEFLAQGKTVLFVSEKMAALEVVQSRLKSCGFGDHTLELHSRKANKRHVLAQLEQAFQLEDPGRLKSLEGLEKLKTVRRELNDYATALHSPTEPFGKSPFWVLGELASLQDTRLVEGPWEQMKGWSHQDYETGIAALEDLVEKMKLIGLPADHPWRGCDLGSANELVQQRLRERLDKASQKLASLEEQVRVASTRESLPMKGPGEVLGYRELFRHFKEAHRLPARLLEVQDAGALSRELEPHLELLGDYLAARENILERFHSGVFDETIAIYLKQLEQDYSGSLKRFFSPGYHKIKGRIRKQLREKGKLDHETLLLELRAMKACGELKLKVLQIPEAQTEMLGELWAGPNTRLEELKRALEWLRGYQEKEIQPENREQFRDYLLTASNLPAGLVEMLELLGTRVEDFLRLWERFREEGKISEEEAFGKPLGELSFARLGERFTHWSESFGKLVDWTRYQMIAERCRELGLGSYLRQAVRERYTPGALLEFFRKGFLFRVLQQQREPRLELKTFDSQLHQGKVKQFQELDRLQWDIAKHRLKQKLYAAKPTPGWVGSSSSELGYLQHQFQLKRRHAPIRTLIRKARSVILRLCPCFLMSPLSVAQFLEPGGGEFDLVVFDEASQISPEDCLGSLLRGKQLVVVGDTRQLPPTPFFKSGLAEEEGFVGEAKEGEEDELLPDLDSVLEECLVTGFPQYTLRWHYRSRHESLIHFSNKHIYDGRLTTFPSAVADPARSGISLIHLPDAVYDRGGSATNQQEAEAIAAFAFKQLKERPDLSLGIAAFSQRQQLAIIDALEELRHEDPSLEEHFTREEEPVFVKNLETVQGDERDVIAISVGYGRDKEGKFSMNFGPLNMDGGERRLNVLVTRARERVVVFSSVLATDFELGKTQSRGVELLKHYLAFAQACEDGSLRKDIYSVDEFSSESRFQEALFKQLLEAGVNPITNIGYGESKLEMAILHPQDPLRFILALESDGEGYRNFRTARDRDRLRQQVLERLGWGYQRVWSLDWLLNPDREQERLFSAVRKAEEAALKEEGENENPEQEGINHYLAVDQDGGEGQRDSCGIQIKHYQRYKDRKKRGPEDFYRLLARQGKKKELEELLEKIVTVEGPILQRELALRVVQAYGLKRLGARSELEIDQQLESLVTRELMVEEEGFFRTPEVKPKLLRTRKAVDGVLDIELVPPSEMKLALELVARNEIAINRDQLLNQAARVLGFSRAGTRIAQRLAPELEALLESGILYKQEGTDSFRLKEDSMESN